MIFLFLETSLARLEPEKAFFMSLNKKSSSSSSRLIKRNENSNPHPLSARWWIKRRRQIQKDRNTQIQSQIQRNIGLYRRKCTLEKVKFNTHWLAKVNLCISHCLCLFIWLCICVSVFLYLPSPLYPPAGTEPEFSLKSNSNLWNQSWVHPLAASHTSLGSVMLQTLGQHL